MRFQCENCGAQYAIADEKLGKKGVRVRCKKCSEIITVRRDATNPATEAKNRDVISGDSNPGLAAESGFPGNGMTDEGLNLGEDDDLRNALDSVLGDESGEDSFEDELDSNDPDRQATRVFSVQEMEKIRAEQMKASGEPESQEVRDEYQSSGELSAEISRDGQRAAIRDTSRLDDKAEWYVAVNEEQIGPISVADFANRWNQGEFDTESLVWKAGFDDWLPVFEVEEFAFLAAEAEESSSPDFKANFSSDEWSSDKNQSGEDLDFGRSDQDEEPYGDDGYDAFADEDDEDSAEAFAGTNVKWKPRAISSLSSLAQEELANLRPQTAEDDELGLGEDDEEFEDEDSMTEGDSSLLAQIAEEEETTARQIEEERLASEAKAEEQHLKEEESALAAQEAASREQLLEQRQKVSPPEEHYIPPSHHAGMPKWALVSLVGLACAVCVLLTLVITSRSDADRTIVPTGQVAPLAQNVASAEQSQAATPAGEASQSTEQIASAGSLASGQNSLPTQANQEPVGAKGLDKKSKGSLSPTKRAKKIAMANASENAQNKIDAQPRKLNQSKKAQRRAAQHENELFDEKRPAVRLKEEKIPEPKPKPKPRRKKSKGGILDFEDPDDRAFAAETGLKFKPVAKVQKKKVELPPLSNSDVLIVMKRHIEEFKACNRKQKEQDSSVRGRMVVTIKINPNGKVNGVDLKTRQFADTYVSKCIRNVIKTLRFPEFGGGPKKIPFPFTVK